MTAILRCRARSSLAFALIGFSLLVGPPWITSADAAPSGLFEREQLSGDWSGLRPAWEEQGITIEGGYTIEAWRNTRGGLDHSGSVLDNLGIAFTFDAERLLGWTGGTFFLSLLHTGGGSPSDHTGDMQGVSNIDAPDTAKIYEAWYEHHYSDANDTAVLVGLYDLNSEFDVIPSAGLFINPSHGIGPDFAQSGENGPSIFPTTALALRLHRRIGEEGYVLAGIWDGVAGDPDEPHGTHVVLDADDGVLLTVEAGLMRAGPDDNVDRPDHKLALGYWRYSRKFPDIIDGVTERSGNQGCYLLAERAVSREQDDPAQGLSMFARLGFANDKINPIAQYQGIGMVYTGPFAGRDHDQIGVAIARAQNGEAYRTANALEGAETIVELTYRAQLTPWLAIQPDLQYIINPGTDPALKNAVVAGLRVDIIL